MRVIAGNATGIQCTDRCIWTTPEIISWIAHGTTPSDAVIATHLEEQALRIIVACGALPSRVTDGGCASGLTACVVDWVALAATTARTLLRAVRIL